MEEMEDLAPCYHNSIDAPHAALVRKESIDARTLSIFTAMNTLSFTDFRYSQC